MGRVGGRGKIETSITTFIVFHFSSLGKGGEAEESRPKLKIILSIIPNQIFVFWGRGGQEAWKI